jgi:hypothetical protein
MAAFLVFFCISVLSWAQDVCNDWSIHISEIKLGTASQGPPDLDCMDDCFRVYYRVYLEKAGSQQNNDDNQFLFTNFNLTGKLSVSGINTQINTAGFSEVNLKKSVSCTKTDVNDPLLIGLNDYLSPFTPLLSYDPQTNFIAYEVSSANYGNSSQIGWTVQGTTLLFVLAVDVFPNETVFFDSNDFNFNVSFADGTICNSLPVFIGTTSDPIAAKTIVQPNNKCSNTVVGNPTLRFGAAIADPVPAFPNRQKVPVFMAGVDANSNPITFPITFDEIDFLVNIIPDANMYVPKLESGLIIATAKWFCNCSVSLRPADCVEKPRRCAASPAFYALSTELMKTDHFTKPLRGGYNINAIQLNLIGNDYHAYVHDICDTLSTIK